MIANCFVTKNLSDFSRPPEIELVVEDGEEEEEVVFEDKKVVLDSRKL